MRKAKPWCNSSSSYVSCNFTFSIPNIKIILWIKLIWDHWCTSYIYSVFCLISFQVYKIFMSLHHLFMTKQAEPFSLFTIKTTPPTITFERLYNEGKLRSCIYHIQSTNNLMCWREKKEKSERLITFYIREVPLLITLFGKYKQKVSHPISWDGKLILLIQMHLKRP